MEKRAARVVIYPIVGPPGAATVGLRAADKAVMDSKVVNIAHIVP